MRSGEMSWIFWNYLNGLFIFIYLLDNHLNPASLGLARINDEERDKKEGRVRRANKRKGIEAQKVKHPIDALIGDNNRTENRRGQKETGSVSPSQLLWTIHLPPTTRRDHTVSQLFFLPPTARSGIFY